MTATDSNSSSTSTSAQAMEQQANAMLFVADMKTNVTMKQQWQSLIADINSKIGKGDSDDKKKSNYQEKLMIIDNWIANKGYNATASAVLKLTKTPFYQDYQKQNEPTRGSWDFVQKLLSDNKLLAGWQAAMAKTSKGDSKATINFLAGDNYKNQNFNCNPIQVRASFIEMRDQNAKYWCGIYGNSVINPIKQSQSKQASPDSNNGTQPSTDSNQADQPKNKSQAGPVIIVSCVNRLVKGKDGKEKYKWEPQLSVDQEILTDLNSINYSKGVLTWKKADDPLFGVQHSGKLTFSQVTRAAKKDSYIGNEFFGTITYPGPYSASSDDQGSQASQGNSSSTAQEPVTYSILGRIGKPPQRVQISKQAGHVKRHIRLPPKVHLTGVQKIQKYIGYLGMAMTVGFAIHIALQFGQKIASFFGKGNEQLEADLNESTNSDVENMDMPQETVNQESPEPMENQNLDDIEGLPDAENVAEMENAADNISEDGAMEQSEDDVQSEDEQVSEDDPPAEDEVAESSDALESGGTEAEEVLSDLSELTFL